MCAKFGLTLTHFFLTLIILFLCLIDNYRHNIHETQKPPQLIYHTIGANYTYMIKFPEM